MSFSVACAQFAPRKADVPRNLDRIAELAVQAQTEGADLVVFPETAATGYFLEGGVLEASLTEQQLLEGLQTRLAGKLTRPLDLVLGFYENDGGNLYNAAAYLEVSNDGARLVHVYKKFFLPTYGVFDEERYVTKGRALGVFDTRFGRVGLLVCEDIWHSFLPALCAVNGAQLIITISASPGRGFRGETVSNHDRYRRLQTAVSEEHGVFCVNCQLCGFEGGKGFIGGSLVTDPMGKLVAEAPLLDEAILVSRIDLDLVPIARSNSPLVADLQTSWADIQRIVAESDI